MTMGVITDYIEAQPVEQQPALTRVYQVLKQTLPDAEERLSYGMPAFFQPKALIYFGANKHHIGIYPTGEGMAFLAANLADFKTTKGSWHLPYDQPLPESLLVAIAKHRLAVVSD